MGDVTIRISGRWLRQAVAGAIVLAVMVPVAVSAAGGNFTDDDDSVFEDNIEWLAAAGVTAGCNPPDNDNFCPDDNVRRGQMAAFMQRFAQYLGAEDGTPAQADNADTLDGMDSADFQPAVVPPGETIYGTIGTLDNVSGPSFEAMGNASLHIPAPVGLTDETVTVAGDSDDVGGYCTGTAEEPTAAPGHVCIYPYSEFNVSTAAGYIWGSGDGTRWGFQLSVFSAGAGAVEFAGNWAYTAPLSMPAEVAEAAPTPGAGGE